MKHSFLRLTLMFFPLFLTLSSPAKAGVFTLTQFVEDGDWSIGLEPEVTLTNSSGFGINAKFTYGLSSLSNVQFGFGPGSGARGFRIGGAYTFDFIPDIEGQVGMGVAFQGYWVKLKNDLTANEFTIVPYVHKSFELNSGTSVDPYISMPIGMTLCNGQYKGLLTGVIGSFFHLSQNFSYSLELGINLAHQNPYADSYIAGGLVYTH